MLALFILTILGVHSTIGLTITPIRGIHNNLTDSGFWLEENLSFYWADYYTSGNQPCIFRFDYSTKRIYSAYIENKTLTAYLVPVKKCVSCTFDNVFMSGSLHDNYEIYWDGFSEKAKILENRFRIGADDPTNHMDLAAANPRGKLIVGTTNYAYFLGAANQSLYSYKRETGVKELANGFKSTAGLAFDGDKIYHNDVCRQRIEVLERDISGNYVKNLVYDFASSNPTVLPSGLEIDNNGFLYITGYGTGTVWRINPKTKTATIIATLPSICPIAVAFGGPGLKTLFVVASAVLFNETLNVVAFDPTTPPIYKITGLNARGIRSQNKFYYSD